MPQTTNRIFSIDLLRGIVMILMALDHVRDFMHNDAFLHEPLDLTSTTPLLFFTRWITHYCAPVFVFLSGVSAYLMGLKKNKAELAGFLIKRGLWLIFIEFAIVGLGWTFDLHYKIFVFQVIGAIGMSMFILGLLVRLPYTLIFIIGIALVFGHNLLDNIEFSMEGILGLMGSLMHGHAFTVFPVTQNHSLLIIYGFLPWTGIMLCGYCVGKLFEPNQYPGKRKKVLLYAGINLLILFIALRLINAYGDPAYWMVQKNSFYTFLSFINVNKYPPSLMYTCLTLGPALILISLTENLRNPFTQKMAVFGRVPFFYYIIHIYVIHLITVIVFYATGFSTADIQTPGSPFLFRPATLGFNLYFVYAIWIGLIIVLYPICSWYNNYKTKNKHWWLSYL
ncbi:MAG: heparan-alpha-glucosaminide N-acetyltransferase domain-containing protein [Bacteroidota bacterium]|nr:heparan-alpha-glucosaminide N-acetyltransferase domain-containing protein [Bacteroidota bacterium]